MPPRFLSEEFTFTTEEPVPDYIEGDPILEDRHPQKIWLIGVPSNSGEPYALAVDVDTWITAALLKNARFRHLEEMGRSDGVLIKLPGEK